jgi:hypothetical protein
MLKTNAETVAIVFSMLVLGSVFGYSLYIYSTPKRKVWVGEVFICIIRTDSYTVIESHGQGTLVLNGSYTLEEGATSQITSNTINENNYMVSIEAFSLTS